MFIRHLRADFYEQLLGRRILMLASCDVDSLCTVKIFQHLFQTDEIAYIVAVIETVDQLSLRYEENRDFTDVILLINCGGACDIANEVKYSRNVTIYLLDSRRPIHILNIYNLDNTIKIVTPLLTSEDVPDFDDIFRDDIDDVHEEMSSDSDTDTQDEEDDNGNAETLVDRLRRKKLERQRKIDRHELRLAEVQQWTNKRDELLFNYSKYNYYGPPSSLVALEVAWSKSIGDPDLVWWAAIGLTEYLILDRIDRTAYTLLVSDLQSHIGRLAHSTNGSATFLQITLQDDFYLYLYRHWNLYRSMESTPVWRERFHLWLSRNHHKLSLFFAKSGLPLREVKKEFWTMNLEMRRNLRSIVDKKREEFQLGHDIMYHSFFATYGYNYKFSAMDICLSIIGVLENPLQIDYQLRFLTGLSCLSRKRMDLIENGMKTCKEIIVTANEQVQCMVDLKDVYATNSLLYCVIQYGRIGAHYFATPCCLQLLAHTLLKAYVFTSSKSRHARTLPLVLFSPLSADRHIGVGIPPIGANINQNLFGKAFEEVAKKLPDGMMLNYIDRNICTAKSTEIQKIIDALTSLMT